MTIELEICCYSTADVVRALHAGADRVELCAGEPEGGTTPSLGVLETTIAAGTGQIFPMVRPRGGSFVYDDFEIAAMTRDVANVAALGFPGVVFGALTHTSELAVDVLTDLVHTARSINPHIEITFHRAFDVVRSPMRAYDDLTNLGFDRILTSGQQPTAVQGVALIGQLLARRGAAIMPGGGIRPANVRMFTELGARNVHSSASAKPGAGVDPAIVETLRTLTAESTS